MLILWTQFGLSQVGYSR